MVSVGDIEGELALLPLFRGLLDAKLVVDKPDLLLETNSSGQTNWQFKESPPQLLHTGRPEAVQGGTFERRGQPTMGNRGNAFEGVDRGRAARSYSDRGRSSRSGGFGGSGGARGGRRR